MMDKLSGLQFVQELQQTVPEAVYVVQDDLLVVVTEAPGSKYMEYLVQGTDTPRQS